MLWEAIRKSLAVNANMNLFVPLGITPNSESRERAWRSAVPRKAVPCLPRCPQLLEQSLPHRAYPINIYGMNETTEWHFVFTVVKKKN